MLHTISRFNLQRAYKKIRLPYFAPAAARIILAALRFSDTFRRGMFINAYFRKTPSRSAT